MGVLQLIPAAGPDAGEDTAGALERLQRETAGDPRIRVAVLDGPVDRRHECFRGAQLVERGAPRRRGAGRGAATEHGTHIASVIFGRDPVGGVAPGCTGLLFPIFGDRPEGGVEPCSQLDLARAITEAIELGAHVINVSGGQLASAPGSDLRLERAVQLCADLGILLIAAAGNDACDCVTVPALLSPFLVVGAMDANGAPLGFSNWGAPYRERGLLAPGQDILGARPGGGVARRSGTSYAAAVTSGIAGLLLSLQLREQGATDPRAVHRALLASALGCAEHPIADCTRLLRGRLDIDGARHLLIPRARAQSQGDASMIEIPDSQPLPDPAADALETMRTAAASNLVPPAPSLPESGVAPAAIQPSDCGCNGGGGGSASSTSKSSSAGGETAAASRGPWPPTSLAYVIGRIGYDFPSQARRDAFIQRGAGNPHDPAALLAFLDKHPYASSELVWTIEQDDTPIYAIQPGGPFAAEEHARLRELLGATLHDGVECISVPGIVGGMAPLRGGQKLPMLWPNLLGMYSWSTKALVEAAVGEPPNDPAEREAHAKKQEAVGNFLQRIYYELRNLGRAAPERALNFAATNAFQAAQVFSAALRAELQLDAIQVERSPLGRPGAECWDVKLGFFDPAQRLTRSRRIYRFTIDVSDVLPVTIGKVRSWDVF